MGIINDAFNAICNQQVPSVNRSLGLSCFLLNIVIPGSGTLIAAIDAEDRPTIIIALIQFWTSPFVFGLIFSVWWGALILYKSKHHEEILLGIPTASIYTDEMDAKP